ncbi:peptidoglycan-binding protein [Ornithinibacillus halotolerans]|nr:peptidoglycan-binding protein [Ornithinibacillus halotolerans]
MIRSILFVTILLIYSFIISPQIIETEAATNDTVDDNVEGLDVLVDEVEDHADDQEVDMTTDVELVQETTEVEVGLNDNNTDTVIEEQEVPLVDTSKEQVNEIHNNEIQNEEEEELSEEPESDEEEEETYFSRGMTDPRLIEVKKDLAELGFVSWKNEPNGYFGGSTEEAVIAFQQTFGLEPSGIIDDVTLNKLSEVKDNPFRTGKKHEETIVLKEHLAILGYVKWNNPPNNYYGSQTASAVSKFQKDNSLLVTGVVDSITKTKLSEMATGPLQNGMYREDAVAFKENLETLGFIKWKNTPNDFFGSSTEKALLKLQAYYRIPETGVVDQATLTTINEVLASPLQVGNRADAAVQLKLDLETLGYVTWKNAPNTYYGSSTKKAVEAFQRAYKLPVSGIAEEFTLNKVNEILHSPNRFGTREKSNIQLKKNLERLGFVKWKNEPNNYYGSSTEQAVERFQKHFGLPVSGIAEILTLDKMDNVLNSPLQKGIRHADAKQLKKDLDILGYANWKNTPNNYFGDSTEQAVKRFQKDKGLPISGIVDEITLKALNKAKKGIVKIFLDPGHGGKDPGGQGFGLKEKNIVLDIALQTLSYLTSKYVGVDVKISRSTDTFIELEDRSKMANKWGADYFVSFHTNAYLGLSKGFETYIYNGKVSNETKNRQKDIHNYLAKRIDVNDRGMKTANFNVLRNTNMPAILLEYMYIDNKAENKLLASKSYRAYLGRITADAIAHSFGLKKR